MRSGIEFMNLALQKSMSGDFTVPPFVDPIDQNMLKRLLRTAKTVHDYKLEQLGSRIDTGSVRTAPYDKKLRSKRKYKSLDPKDTKLEDYEILGSDKEMVLYVRLCS